MSNTEETVEVPVLELEFENFLEICKKINLVDSVTVFSMPNHVKTYTDREKKPVSDLVMELIDYQKPENEWRLKVHKVQELAVDNDSIKILDKTISDAARIVIISKMNSAFIIPGDKSIKSGNCQPNEIIKFSNMISSRLFLLQFNDVKEEGSNNYNLRVEFNLINRTSIEDKHED